VYFCTVVDGEPVGGDGSTKPGSKKNVKSPYLCCTVTEPFYPMCTMGWCSKL